MNFCDQLNQAIERNNSLLVVGLDPNPELLPTWYHEETLVENLKKWLIDIIDETKNFVCAYKPTLGFYTALGYEGFVLLESILSYIPENFPVILDAKHSDLNTSTFVAQQVFEKWNISAITLNPYSGQDLVSPFIVYPDKSIFILCHTSNPAGKFIQNYPHKDNPLYLHIIQEVKRWGTLEQICLEVGSFEPEVFDRVRQLAPERIILARSIWEKPENFTPLVQAGLNQQRKGLLIPVPNDTLSKPIIRRDVEKLNQEINKIREAFIPDDLETPQWISDIPYDEQHPYQDLVLQLFDIGCLMFGEYVQASGATFSYYIDLRKIISNPPVFNKVLYAYADILNKLQFQRIAGIPYGSLPTATGLSLLLNHPMIYPRKEVKAHGTRRLIEGNYQEGETVAVIDDILISGKSVLEGIKKLESSGLIVNDIVVFIDHEKGVKDKIKAEGYNAYSVLGISEITEILYHAGRITSQQYHLLSHV